MTNFPNTTLANNLYPVANATTSSSPFVDVFLPRDPNTNDINYPTQKKWLNTTDGTFWELQGFISSGGVVLADWIKIGSVGLTETLTGNSGGAVPATANNINVLGDGVYITTVGTPATSTLTIETAGGIATLFTEDTGTASASSGNLNVFGGTGISTHGSGNTITVSGKIAQAAASSSLTNDGVASFNNNHFTVDANGFVSAAGAVAISFVENTGTATPSAGVLNVLGSGGITTSGSGNTVTISGSGMFNQITNQVFTTSGTYTPTAGMLYCSVQCLGGGGAGGGSQSASGTFSIGSGGGGGEYASGIFSAAAIGGSQTVTIGAGGTGVSSAAGNNGGNTSLGALISADGGGGGQYYSAGSAGGVGGGSGGTGGSGGDYRCNGQPGDYAYSIALVSYSGRGGANSQLGAGGSSVPSVASQGGNATGYGAGGGGSVAIDSGPNLAGGNGSSGIVIVTEYIG